ncbi:hypothetical protein Clacol_000952 [Clathrus columnatus]|uniref:Fe2OG dioxygenase domain-containing protein n=1 Tax=Clathrus columnatus TaxID=1419009 RepID=A0AAV5A2H0_9AGAM|nr:hypothetical protein Clacol_000952 [Clathrus columnatus]
MPVFDDFTSVPVLDYDLLKTGIGSNHSFLYLANPPVPRDTIDNLISYIPRVFALPQEEKDKIAMRNSQCFLGYNRFGSEFTKGSTDLREQFDFASPYISRWEPGKPEYLRLWGDSQWPDDKLIPGFRQTVETYINQVGELSFKFVSLTAEALGLPPNGLDKFYDNIPTVANIQQRCKLVKYPPINEGGSKQGVGPHYDASFLTFLLQASPHEGLQVQNIRGEWIPASPIPGTFVVNIGKGLETATRGVAKATSHRVVSPSDGSGSVPGPRYSVPLFQNISQTVRVCDEILTLPEEVIELARTRGDVAPSDSINFSEYDRDPSGQVNLIGRIKSHPDVAERHYPELFKHYFPNGLPSHGNAY